MNSRIETEKLEKQLRTLVEDFSKKVKVTASKNLFSVFVIYLGVVLLALLLFISLTLWISPLLTAISLSGLLIGLFSGYIFTRYLSLNKPNLYKVQAQKFAESCIQTIPYRPGTSIYHATLGMAYALLAGRLKEEEYTYLTLKKLPKVFLPLSETLSCILYWKDLFILREILLLASLDEYLHLVRTDPIHLTYHSQLANAYVLLARLYRDPRTEENTDEKKWISKKKTVKKWMKNTV